MQKRILLVEDYAPNVIVAEAIIEACGFTCDSATNGLEALRKFKESSYSLILMDLNMHGMDGLETTRQIRAFEKINNLPKSCIIAMSAHESATHQARCIEAGMDGYLAKPLDIAALEKTLHSYKQESETPFNAAN